MVWFVTEKAVACRRIISRNLASALPTVIPGTNDVAALRTIAEHVQEVVGAAGQETQQEVRWRRGLWDFGVVCAVPCCTCLRLHPQCLHCRDSASLCVPRSTVRHSPFEHSVRHRRPLANLLIHGVPSLPNGPLQVSAPPALNLDTAQDAAGEVLRLAGAAADEVAAMLAAAVAGRTAQGLGAAAAGDAAAEEQAAAGEWRVVMYTGVQSNDTPNTQHTHSAAQHALCSTLSCLFGALCSHSGPCCTTLHRLRPLLCCARHTFVPPCLCCPGVLRRRRCCSCCPSLRRLRPLLRRAAGGAVSPHGGGGGRGGGGGQHAPGKPGGGCGVVWCDAIWSCGYGCQGFCKVCLGRGGCQERNAWKAWERLEVLQGS